MRDSLEFDCTPCNEPCWQVGSPGYDLVKAKAEAWRHISVIRQKLGKEPPGAKLTVKLFSHDLGDYFAVVCYFEGREAEEYAYRVDSEGPVSWDDIGG